MSLHSFIDVAPADYGHFISRAGQRRSAGDDNDDDDQITGCRRAHAEQDVLRRKPSSKPPDFVDNFSKNGKSRCAAKANWRPDAQPFCGICYLISDELENRRNAPRFRLFNCRITANRIESNLQQLSFNGVSAPF